MRHWADKCMLTAGLAEPAGQDAPIRFARATRSPLLRLCGAALLAAVLCGGAVLVVQAGDPEEPHGGTAARLRAAPAATSPG